MEKSDPLEEVVHVFVDEGRDQRLVRLLGRVVAVEEDVIGHVRARVWLQFVAQQCHLYVARTAAPFIGVRETCSAYSLDNATM